MKIHTTFIDLLSSRLVIMLHASFVANIHLFAALAFDVNFVLLSAASASASTSAFLDVFVFSSSSIAVVDDLFVFSAVVLYELDASNASRTALLDVSSIYHLFCTIETMHDFWREWTIELDSDFFVQTLKDTYKAIWRRDQKNECFLIDARSSLMKFI